MYLMLIYYSHISSRQVLNHFLYQFNMEYLFPWHRNSNFISPTWALSNQKQKLQDFRAKGLSPLRIPSSTPLVSKWVSRVQGYMEWINFMSWTFGYANGSLAFRIVLFPSLTLFIILSFLFISLTYPFI